MLWCLPPSRLLWPLLAPGAQAAVKAAEEQVAAEVEVPVQAMARAGEKEADTTTSFGEVVANIAVEEVAANPLVVDDVAEVAVDEEACDKGVDESLPGADADEE